MNSVVIPEKIVCCICSANVTFADLESHLAVLHFNSDPYQCDQCDYDYDNPPSRFPTEAAVKEHMRGKHGASDFSYRVWCNPEIDRSRENISNCMAQSVQNTLRFPETRTVSGMTVNSVNILAPPPVPVIINDILKDNSTTYQPPATYEMPQSRKYARTSTVPNVMINRAAQPVISNGKSIISQRPTSYQMPQSRNTVVQTPISAHPLESARPKLITVTRTPTYQSGTTYEMPQSHIVVVRTPISPPESARSKLVTVTGSPMNEEPQLIPSKASASRPQNSEIEVIKIESDDELDVKLDLRQSEFQQSGTSYEIPQSRNAVVQTPISASSPESAERKLVTVTRAGNSTTYQLDATDQISQISNPVVQTAISAPSPERAKRKFVTATGASMNERPLLTASKASTSRPYTNLENDLGSYDPNCDVIVLDSDEEGDESCPNDNEITKKREMDKRSANTMRMRNRRQNSHLLPNSVRCDENYLVQCKECNVWVKNFVWNKKAHINRMHLQLATYICKICNQSYYYNSPYEAEKHVKLKHKKPVKGITAFIHEQKHHWNIVSGHIHEFFPNLEAKKIVERLCLTSRSQSATTDNSVVGEKTGMPVETNSSVKIKQNLIPCHVCGDRITKNLEVAKAHINGVHLQFPLYTCGKCNREYKSYNMALKHAQDKHPGNQLQGHLVKWQPVKMVKDHPDKQKHWDMLDDRITEFFPTFFTSPAQVDRNLDHEHSEDNVYSPEDSNAGTRSDSEPSTMPELDELEKPSRVTKVCDSNGKCPLESNKGAKATALVDNSRPKELIQCRECRLWMVKKLGLAKTHINGMHLHFPLYKCTECDSEHDSYAHAIKHRKDGEQHSIQDHPDKKNHWDMLDNRIKEFFPTFLASAAKLKRNLNFEKRVLGAVKTELDTDLISGHDLNPATNSALGTISSHRASTNSGLSFTPEIKAEPEEINEQAGMPNASNDEAIEKVIQLDPEKAFAKFNHRFCRACRLNISCTQSKSVMYNHVNLKHARYPLFKCAKKNCQKRFYEYHERMISKHINECHNGDLSLIRDNRADYDEQLKKRCIELFGMTHDSELGTSSDHEFCTNSRIIPEQAPAPNSNSEPNFTPKIKTEPELITEQSEDFFGTTPDSEPGTSSNHGLIQPAPEKAVLPTNYLFCGGCLINVYGKFPSTRLMYNHVNINHTRYPLWECTGCQQTFHDYDITTILKHVNEMHHGVSKFIQDNRTKYDKQLMKRSRELFGLAQDSEPRTSSSHGPRTSQSKGRRKLIGSDSNKYDLLTKTRYKACGGCQELIGIYAKPMLYSHINVRHARFPVWECAACGKAYYEYVGSAISRHVNDQHDGDRSLIRDNRSKYAQHLKRKCVEFFGMIP